MEIDVMVEKFKGRGFRAYQEEQKIDKRFRWKP